MPLLWKGIFASLQARHKTATKYAHREIYSWDELLGSVLQGSISVFVWSD
jgi:hypothetical protein